MHLIKVWTLPHSDLFIRSLDLSKQFIEYQVVEKGTYKPLEPIKKDILTITSDQIIFDKNRTLPLDYAEYIEEVLKPNL